MTNFKCFMEEQIIINEGSQADWNQNDATAPDYVKNRTHYSSGKAFEDIIWDGSETGYSVVEPEEGLKLVKVSDHTPSQEELVGTIMYVDNGEIITITSELISDMNGLAYHAFYGYISDGIYVILSPDEFCNVANMPIGTFTKGIYFSKTSDYFITALCFPERIVKLDEKYLPKMAAVAKTGSYNDLKDVPTLSTVAQTGNYKDLNNLPIVDQTYSPTSENAQSGIAVAKAVDEVAGEALAVTELLQDHIRIVEGNLETTTISFADKANRTSFDKTIAQVWEQNGIKVTNNKGAGSNIGDYANPIRFYIDSEVIIEYPNMSKIEIVANDVKYVVTADSITDTNATAIVADNVTTITFANPVDSFTIPALKKQARIMSMNITSGGPDQTWLTSSIPQEDSDVANKKYVDNAIANIEGTGNSQNQTVIIQVNGDNLYLSYDELKTILENNDIGSLRIIDNGPPFPNMAIVTYYIITDDFIEIYWGNGNGRAEKV